MFFVGRKDRLAIDPIQLPLPDADPDRLYTAPEDFVLFNGIRDAAPDGWGRHLMWDGKGWRLSPVYDIVPYPQVSLERDLAIGVGRNGRQATLKNALSDAASFGLPRSQAITLAVDTQKKVKANWEAVFTDSGITGAELERLRTCFIACDEAIQQPEVDAI